MSSPKYAVWMSASCNKKAPEVVAEEQSFRCSLDIRSLIHCTTRGIASPDGTAACPLVRCATVHVCYQLGEGEEEHLCLRQGTIKLDSHAQLVAVLMFNG